MSKIIWQPVIGTGVNRAARREVERDLLTRANIRTIRASRMSAFRARQSTSREWISFAEIADELVVSASAQERQVTYEQLRQSLLGGEFEHDGRSRVLFLHPTTPMAKMTQARLAALDSIGVDRLQSAYLANCWIPADFARRWLETRHVTAPSSLIKRTELLPVPKMQLRVWYEARVRDWPRHTRHPSELADRASAAKAFPTNRVTRDSVRQIRAELAPEAWLMHGRRKPARK